MLAEMIDIVLPVYVSLLVILVCITTAIVYSMYSTNNKAAAKNTK
jgi:cbb3-type cytochrome oxidase subunit 3